MAHRYHNVFRINGKHCVLRTLLFFALLSLSTSVLAQQANDSLIAKIAHQQMQIDQITLALQNETFLGSKAKRENLKGVLIYSGLIQVVTGVIGESIMLSNKSAYKYYMKPYRLGDGTYHYEKQDNPAYVFGVSISTGMIVSGFFTALLATQVRYY